MVEFVLVLPLLVTLIFVVFQLGIAFDHYLRVSDAARGAARAAAVARFNSTTPCDAASAAANQAANGLTITVGPCTGSGRQGDPVTVTVTSPYTISLPLLPLSDTFNIQSTATERSE
jgi:Flp pilus assembly protein TadG